MSLDDWHFTQDMDEFLARTGDFLRSRPVMHNTPLTTLAKMQAHGANAHGVNAHGVNAHGAEATVFGRLESGGEVRAIAYRTARGRLTATPLAPEQADTLAARLTRLGHRISGVTADQDTAAVFAEAWRRHQGAAPVRDWWGRLYRLGTLTPPEPAPQGRGRQAGERDHEHVMSWCREFAADVGEAVTITAESWAGTRFAEKRYTYWETPDGTPVSMAGANPLVGGQVRVDPVYTPAGLRGRGYAGAVTVEVTRAALAAGATEVVLFTNPANTTSNALYQRIGYVPVTDFTGYAFSG
ncbi:GNAT family N-acetyltransferase [Streptomyces sp. NPDC058751]|uniref:GNAT family N-acetyltransferase n=1 Tax=Streptomyces sp. NPDC058751 TaxID=3346623 RepID=UPI0036CC3E2F